MIEDSLDLQEAYIDILILNGYEVETASNSHEGISKYKEGKFYLVLMDSDMPKLNGFQSFLQIKECDKDSKVIIITGYSPQGKVFSDLIKKGFTPLLQNP